MFGRGIQAPEIILILLVIVLLFGAKKLPDLARGVGRSLRIFKAETKGMTEDEKKVEKAESPTPPAPLEVEAHRDDVSAPSGSDSMRDPVGEVTDLPRRDV
jgi:sec-independent protein translocase protein TatA